MLATLFAHHGAPLVLKSDNGSHFDNAGVQELLRMWNVAHLFSPPHWPRYNGAVEAGIGSLKSRTDACAARHGLWTWDDVAAALREANTFARPRGERGPSPDELWRLRSPIATTERHRFAASVSRQMTLRNPEADSCEAGQSEVQSMRGSAREAIRLALEECGYLTYTRRRIPPPIPRRKGTAFRRGHMSHSRSRYRFSLGVKAASNQASKRVKCLRLACGRTLATLLICHYSRRQTGVDRTRRMASLTIPSAWR
jgi:hypothetical protein